MKRSPPVPNSRTKRQKSTPTSVSSLNEAISFLSSGGTRGASRALAIRSIQIVEDASHSVGLSSEDLLVLLQVIGCQRFGTKISRQLVTCLIPNNVVPEEAVICVISRLCTNKLNLTVQVDLIKWILAVYDYIEGKEKFYCLYGVIFLLVENDLMCPYVCQLLYKMTKKHDVLPFRVRHLIDLQSRVGPQPHLLALLGLFGLHRPDLVTTQCKYKKSFKSLGRLQSLVEKVKTNQGPTAFPPKGMEHMQIEVALVAKEEVKTFRKFKEVIESLNGPDAVMKLLHSPLRRLLFTSYLPHAVLLKFSLWLRMALISEISLNTSTMSICTRGQLLPLIANISSELQEGVPEVEYFLSRYLQFWDGHTNFSLLLDLVQYWELCPFEKLSEIVLQPIYKYFCLSSMQYKCSVIQCFTKLYQHWVLWATSRYIINSKRNLDKSKSKTRQITVVFDRNTEDLNPDLEVWKLANYIDRLCVVALTLHSDHPPLLLHQILKFYDTIILTRMQESTTALLLPSPLVVYASAFSTSAAPFLHLCNLMTRYREEVLSLRRRNASFVKTAIRTLNSYTTDMCNMIWRCQAFVSDPKTLIFNDDLPSAVVQSVVRPNESFSLFRHPALLNLAVDFINSSKEEIAPQKLLNDPGVRDAYLHHISQSGFTEVINFIHTFIKTKY